VFEERGYRRTAVADIVERAETARGTFYLYFRNKEAIWAEVLTQAIDELYRSAGGPQPNLRAAIRAWLQTYSERLGLWRCTVEAALESPAAASVWMAERDRFMGRLARHLRAEQAEGLARPGDAELVSVALGSMVEWIAFTSMVVREPPADPEWLDRTAEALAAVWDHAVHPD
jgi:AcrR family transcriptional regulator